jgi:hypothetical protein
MNDHGDPPRWSAGGAGSPKLSSLVSAAQRDVATDAQLAELESRLGPLLHASPAAVAAHTTPLLVKLAAGAAVAAVVASAVWYVRARSTRGPTTPAALTRSSSAPVAAVTPSGTTAGLAQASPPEAAASNASGLAGVPAQNPVTAASRGSLGDTGSSQHGDLGSAQAEAALLEKARSELVSSPAQALATTQEHAQRFPHGLLTQEREVIAISALRRLGRTAEADARAARFDKRYPNSAHQHTVDSTPTK